jgi:methyl-accepting chemotaxis protein-1 (serine sensor receptor)
MFNNLSIKSRLIFVIGFLSLLSIAIGTIGLSSLGTTNAALKTVYEDRVVVLGQLERISALMNGNQVIVAEAVSGQLSAFPEDVAAVDKRVGEIRSGMTEVDRLWKAYRTSRMTPEEARLAEAFDASRMKYGREGMGPALAALAAHDYQQTGEILQGPMRETYPAVRGDVDALIDLQLRVAKGEFDAAQSRFVAVRNVSIAVIVFGVALAALIGFWLIRGISRSLSQAVRIAERVAAGDLTQTIEVRGRDETSQLMEAMKHMNASLADIVGQVRSGTETIAVASRQIASGNADLSSRT